MQARAEIVEIAWPAIWPIFPCDPASKRPLADHGCRTVSLTVTTSNASAIQLYERMGFVNRRDFAAYVWEMK